MTHHTTIEIDAPPERVWATLSAVRDWPAWLPTVERVTPQDAATPDGPGARYEIRQPKLPRAVWEITDWDPQAGFTWRSVSPGITSTGRHEVTGVGDRTRVTLAIEWRGPLAPVLGLVYGRLTDRYIATEAASLKARCEQAA